MAFEAVSAADSVSFVSSSSSARERTFYRKLTLSDQISDLMRFTVDLCYQSISYCFFSS